MVNIASFGVLIQIISMCSTLGSAVGAGLILALIFWIFILTFSIFDLLNLDVVAKIKAASARSATLLVVCPSCGTTQSGQTRFCANCGATLPQIVQQPVYQQPVYQQPVQPAAPAAPVTPQPQQVQQPAPSAYAPAPQAAAETPAQNTCPSCGASCVPGAAFCPAAAASCADFFAPSPHSKRPACRLKTAGRFCVQFHFARGERAHFTCALFRRTAAPLRSARSAEKQPGFLLTTAPGRARI